MIYNVTAPSGKVSAEINLTASKSESNRVLIIQALCKEKFSIINLAAAQDTATLQEILNSTGTKNKFDVGPAGTAMRFLTAYFASKPGTWTLTGSERMKKRPIGVLVDALRDLGADISYLENEGYPPLQINGKVLTGNKVVVDAKVSSQFITALLLISPQLLHGLTIEFRDGVISPSYINMTLKIMEQFGVYGQWIENGVSVSAQKYSVGERENKDFHVEADWSAASYWYSVAALSPGCDIKITGLKKSSLQGDSITQHVFSFFGVKTEILENAVRLTKTEIPVKNFGFDFSDSPDIAQTVAVVASALGIPSILTGLETLKIKETDRIKALIEQLSKFGVLCDHSHPGCLQLFPEKPIKGKCYDIETYDDHRMAMAFAPLSFLCDEGINIENAGVVAKSYPDFWDDLKKAGFRIKEYSPHAQE